MTAPILVRATKVMKGMKMALSNSWFATLFVIAAVGTRRNRRVESLSSGINHPVFGACGTATATSHIRVIR